MGRSPPCGPHVQCREDVSRIARRHRARARPAETRRAAERASSRHRLRFAAQPRDHLGAPPHADQRVGRRLLRDPGPGGSLPPGGARSQAGERKEGRQTPAPRARHVLGIQRRAHQPALARAVAPLSSPAAGNLHGIGAHAAGRLGQFPLGGLRRRMGGDRRAPHAVGAGRLALGRGRLDQRARPGAHRADAARRRLARGASNRAGGLGAAHAAALRDRAGS